MGESISKKWVGEQEEKEGLLPEEKPFALTLND